MVQQFQLNSKWYDLSGHTIFCLKNNKKSLKHIAIAK